MLNSEAKDEGGDGEGGISPGERLPVERAVGRLEGLAKQAGWSTCGDWNEPERLHFFFEQHRVRRETSQQGQKMGVE